MKFQRHARILRGQLNLPAFAGVLFLLLIFLLLGPLVYTSGVPVRLPVSGDLPGTASPPVYVAVDAEGRLYFKNRPVTESSLPQLLREAIQEAGQPLTLVIQGDKSMTNEKLVRLTLLARDAGITNALLATLPRLLDTRAAGAGSR